MEEMHYWIGKAASGIELLAVAIMVAFIVIVTARWLIHMSQNVDKAYERYRVSVGRSLLVGLELLVAADIIRTIVLDTSPTSVALLAALVVMRTFLSWALTLEVEGHWPWQKLKDKMQDNA